MLCREEVYIMEEIVQLIVNNGMSIVLVAYMIFKDYTFNKNITSVLTEIKEVLSTLKQVTLDKATDA